jgi:hypothetical protein
MAWSNTGCGTFLFHLSSLSMKQKGMQETIFLASQDSRIRPLGHCLCRSGGSFTIKTPLKKHSLLALTMIDPATGWLEIVQAYFKTATSIQDLFHNTWLAHYLRPQYIVFDNAGKFKREFKQMCENYGIETKPTTSHNPQANAIIEGVHKVVNNMLRSFELMKENLEEDNPFEYFLQSTAWAIRSTYHTTLQATPCQLLFGRDVIHNIAFKANCN